MTTSKHALKQSYSDVVFNADSKQGQAINFCFLFEHKSYIDEKAPFQILHYISSAMLKRAENDEQQRLIIPILFYHGKKPWMYKPVRGHFQQIDKNLQAYLPDFAYLYHNVQAKPDDEIRSVPNQLIAAALLALKHFYDQGYLLTNMHYFLLDSVDEKGNFYKPLVVYLFDKVSEHTKEIQKIMSGLPTQQKAEAMSILDAYEAKGIAKGIAKGKLEGKSEKTRQACINMINHEFADELICQILEVDAAFVANLRKELKA